MAFDLVGGKTSNEALDARAGASEYARAVGGKGSALASDKARLASGKKSKLIERGSVDLSGAQGNKFAADYSQNKGTLSVTTNNTTTGVSEGALKDIVASFSRSNTSTATLSSPSAPVTVQDDDKEKTSPIMDKVKLFAASKFFFPVLIGVAALAVWFLFIRKK